MPNTGPPNQPPSSTQSVSSSVHAALNPQPSPWIVGTPQQGQPLQQLHFQLQAQNPLFPPPEFVKEYEKALPGSFDRILKLAENAQNAQIESVRFAQQTLKQESRRGTWLGFSVSIIAMACALYCVHLSQAVASIFLGLPVLGIAKALIDSAKAPKPVEPVLPPPPQTPNPGVHA
jgi:uncharacterized membrane protein